MGLCKKKASNSKHYLSRNVTYAIPRCSGIRYRFEAAHRLNLQRSHPSIRTIRATQCDIHQKMGVSCLPKVSEVVFLPFRPFRSLAGHSRRSCFVLCQLAKLLEFWKLDEEDFWRIFWRVFMLLGVKKKSMKNRDELVNLGGRILRATERSDQVTLNPMAEMRCCNSLCTPYILPRQDLKINRWRTMEVSPEGIAIAVYQVGNTRHYRTIQTHQLLHFHSIKHGIAVPAYAFTPPKRRYA